MQNWRDNLELVEMLPLVPFSKTTLICRDKQISTGCLGGFVIYDQIPYLTTTCIVLISGAYHQIPIGCQELLILATTM